MMRFIDFLARYWLLKIVIWAAFLVVLGVVYEADRHPLASHVASVVASILFVAGVVAVVAALTRTGRNSDSSP